MDKELVKYFVNEYKGKQEEDREWNSNHIEMDDWFKYSGEKEEYSEDYKNLICQTKTINLSAKKYLTAKRYKSRKEYFRLYWQKYKLKTSYDKK